MNPETIKRLREDIPEFRELLSYLAAELAKVDSVEGLGKMAFTEAAYEARVRVRTHQRLGAILGPLLDVVDKPLGVDPKEYVT